MLDEDKDVNNMNRRIAVIIFLAGCSAVAASAQTHTSEFPAPKAPPQENRTMPANDRPAAPVSQVTGALTSARVFVLDQMPVRRMANGGESREIVHGTLATGESVNLHQSMQVPGATPNPPHVIHHSEFILVREGELEFQHEADGKMVSEKAGAGDVIYVAYGTMHTVKNVGSVPAKYVVVGIGGDAK
jgi:mannose-6-phosphate isomerase-like protein (cupin superfamily)